MIDFYHDQTRNLLIYPTHQPDSFRHYIPEARPINGAYVAIPRTLQNLQLLRHFNIPVTPIITDQNYSWPIEPGRSPLPHQRQYANFSALHPRMFNLGDPGTMKTLSALWAMDWLMEQHPPGTFRALIVAPLNTLELVWASAIFKNFLAKRSFEILVGTPEKRRNLLAKKADISIINFEGVGIGAHTRKKFVLDGLSKDIAERDDIKLVIIDEARAYGDATSKRSRIAQISLGQRPYLWQITGSPTPGKPTDCYGMAKLMNNAFGKSFRTFQMETMVKVSNFVWKPKRDGYEKARQLLVPAIRFALDDIWNGPKFTVQQRLVDLTPDQKHQMASLKRDLQVVVKTGQAINAVNEAAARQKFIQISLGAVYDANHKAHVVDATPRYQAIADIIESTERKVLVFVPLTSVIHVLVERFSKLWKSRKDRTSQWRCGFINGEVPPKERVVLVRDFVDDPDFKVIFADPQATAHGLNDFVVADTVIWAGATDKPESWIQGNARVYRPGQKYPTSVFQIVSNQLEKDIFNRCETGIAMQGLMLEAVRKGDF